MPRGKKNNGIAVVKIGIRGKSPLIINNDASMEIAQLNNADEQEIAAAKLYVEEGKSKVIGIPLHMMGACLRDAGRKVKVTLDGKKVLITGTRGSLLYGLLSFRGQFFPLKPNKWVADRRKTVNPTTGGRNLTIRPRFDEWGFELIVEVDESIMPDGIHRQLWEYAGRWCGLGDFRPSSPNKPGPFGRFEISSWTKE